MGWEDAVDFLESVGFLESEVVEGSVLDRFFEKGLLDTELEIG